MKKVRCNVGRLSVTDLINKSSSTAKKVKNDARFVNPYPLPDDLLAKANEVVEAGNNASGGDKVMKAIQRKLVAELRSLFRLFINYINSIANGNELLIIATGLSVSRERTPIAEPGKVETLDAKFTGHKGKILLKWVKPEGTKALNIYVAETDTQPLTLHKTVFGSKIMLTDLTSCKYYHFQVEAINKTGAGVRSNIISQIAA